MTTFLQGNNIVAAGNSTVLEYAGGGICKCLLKRIYIRKHMT